MVARRKLECLMLNFLSGERVSNAYATCPLDGDNIPKGVLIPNVTALSHERAVKDGLYL